MDGPRRHPDDDEVPALRVPPAGRATRRRGVRFECVRRDPSGSRRQATRPGPGHPPSGRGVPGITAAQRPSRSSSMPMIMDVRRLGSDRSAQPLAHLVQSAITARSSPSRRGQLLFERRDVAADVGGAAPRLDLCEEPFHARVLDARTPGPLLSSLQVATQLLVAPGAFDRRLFVGARSRRECPEDRRELVAPRGPREPSLQLRLRSASVPGLR